MGANSKINWTDATWNPVTGCSKVSAGCANCYAEVMAKRLQAMDQANYAGGFEVACHEHMLEIPLRWKRPRKIFVNSMSDLFHEAVPFEFIDSVMAIIALCPQHTFQVLTKRPERMLEYFTSIRSEGWSSGYVRLMFGRPARAFPSSFSILPLNKHEAMPWPLPNLWLGVTAENQQTADERIPLLLQCPAVVRFVSVEPMLGSVDLKLGCIKCGNLSDAECPGSSGPCVMRPLLDWVIYGGESGPSARPMHPDWARGLRDQCQAANVPFFFKQWGEWQHIHDIDCNWWNNIGFSKKLESKNLQGKTMFRVGKHQAGRLLDGREHNEFPATNKVSSPQTPGANENDEGVR